MILGRIVGEVIASQKEPNLTGLKLLVVENVDASGKSKNNIVIAVDAVGAGVGEVILYASGSSARQTEATKDRPVDAVIMAIVDSVHKGHEKLYDKSTDPH